MKFNDLMGLNVKNVTFEPVSRGARSYNDVVVSYNRPCKLSKLFVKTLIKFPLGFRLNLMLSMEGRKYFDDGLVVHEIQSSINHNNETQLLRAEEKLFFLSRSGSYRRKDGINNP